LNVTERAPPSPSTRIRKHKIRSTTGLLLAMLLAAAWLLSPLKAYAQDQGQHDRGGQVLAAPVAVITQYQLPPQKLQQAEALYRTRMLTFVVGTLYGIGLLIVLLNLQIGSRFRDIAERTSQRRFVQATIFAPLLLLTIDVLSLPIGIYRQYLSRSYDLSVQSWGSWFWDWSKNEIISIVIVTLLIWGLYAILRRSPQRWWLFGWLAMIPVLVLLVFVQPVFIDPLFDTFDPLQAKQPTLVVELQKVMHRGGLSIEPSRMYEMRASEKVTTYNAYVTGIGASKRVVVWDNTAREMTVPQTMFVFGHEQGHYVLNHIWKGMGFAIAGLLIVFYIAHRSIGGIIRRWGSRWQVRDAADWASFPVLLLIFSIITVVSQPLVSAAIRYMEHEADIYGLEVIHGLAPNSEQVGAQAFQRLGEKGLAYPTPNPLYVLWVYDHPTIADRVQFAASYHPWDDGQPTRFIK
jgi:STE24 endopeptidase